MYPKGIQIQIRKKSRALLCKQQPRQHIDCLFQKTAVDIYVLFIYCINNTNLCSSSILLSTSKEEQSEDFS